MMWDLPLSVNIDGQEYFIRNKCDYRVILDVISALQDEDLPPQNRMQCALYIFYEDLSGCNDFKTAVKEMYKIIALGEEEGGTSKPKIMDWEHDFNQLAPPISRVLGYSVRDRDKYTHWNDFVGAFMEIGECSFATVISIRNKRMRGKKLEKWEEEFARNNSKIVNLPMKLSSEDEDFLYSDF